MSPASNTAAALRKTPSKTASKQVARAKPHAATRLVLLVATRKGAWFFHGDASRKAWKADGPHFLGDTMSQVLLDPRDGRTLLAAAKTGHLGPTILLLHQPGPHLEGGAATTGLCCGQRRPARPIGGPHLLAHARARQRT